MSVWQHLVRRLEAKPAELSAKQQARLTEARAALQVPEPLVKSMAEYSRDPALLYRYRNRLGELIDRAALPDADPWGESFGVRGFLGR